jgi:hypothetical protein
VVFGVAGPAPGTLGLPGAVTPGLPPAPPVCAIAAVEISAADSIATGIKHRADIIGFFYLREFRDILIRAQSSSCGIVPNEARLGLPAGAARSVRRGRCRKVTHQRYRNSGPGIGVCSLQEHRRHTVMRNISAGFFAHRARELQHAAPAGWRYLRGETKIRCHARGRGA